MDRASLPGRSTARGKNHEPRKAGFRIVAGRWDNRAQFVNLRIRTLSTNPKAASVAITDEPP